MQPSTCLPADRGFIPCRRSRWFAAVAMGCVSAAWAAPVTVAATATGSFGGVRTTAAGCGTVFTLGTRLSCDATTSEATVHSAARADFGGRQRGETSVTQTAAGTGTLASAFEFELLAGSSFFDFNFQFATNAFVRAGVAGSASTSYFRTASIEDFQFFDRAGNDVTASGGIQFTPGEFYGAVPEPTSLALVGCAWGLLVWQRRRQRSDIYTQTTGF